MSPTTRGNHKVRVAKGRRIRRATRARTQALRRPKTIATSPPRTNPQRKNRRNPRPRRLRPAKRKSRETVKARKSAFLRAERIFNRLESAYPDAKCALHFSNPLQLLVATILSAQSTDKMVNIVTPE